ncbi:MAG: bacterioferritin [Polaribacter sp.]|jgi:bacterioferritin
MKGNQKVIEQLQHLLESELTAFDQYFIHARMYADWGLTKLDVRISHEADEEKLHAQMLIDRILFLESTPDLSKRSPLNVGIDVLSMLKNDLDYEYAVADKLRVAIAVCEQESDFQTRQILLKLLEDTEEDHMYWLEQQVGLISKIGSENYIQSQM